MQRPGPQNAGSRADERAAELGGQIAGGGGGSDSV
jgi:hypothetical protein